MSIKSLHRAQDQRRTDHCNDNADDEKSLIEDNYSQLIQYEILKKLVT